MSMRTISSDFDGIDLSTSALRRRSRCGPSRSCSLTTWSSLDRSENSCKKPFKSLKSWGRKKCSK
ncbi:hypothetical protein BpHYR1_050431 [Brachionus plicatilis]|uniref:Uncharacterized protein n=1 Tax=Brachionus plicatilis TaxID=10195 RepID=A0A3M7SZX6_BRAPC|nr:hypothetical protein BpHYR1_050431 [Brachionus plicatilis]